MICFIFHNICFHIELCKFLNSILLILFKWCKIFILLILKIKWFYVMLLLKLVFSCGIEKWFPLPLLAYLSFLEGWFIYSIFQFLPLFLYLFSRLLFDLYFLVFFRFILSFISIISNTDITLNFHYFFIHLLWILTICKFWGINLRKQVGSAKNSWKFRLIFWS